MSRSEGVPRGEEVRWVAIAVALIMWIWAFTVLHGAQNEFRMAPGGFPSTLIIAFGLTLLVTVSVAVTALLKLPVWPQLALAAGVLVVLTIYTLYRSELHAIAVAANDTGLHLPTHIAFGKPISYLFKVAGLKRELFTFVGSLLLILIGATGLILGPGRTFADDRAQGGAE